MKGKRVRSCWSAVIAAALIGSATSAQTPPGPAAASQPTSQGPNVPTRVTAETLTRLCGEDRSACLTYILGAADAFSAALTAAGRPQVFCFPQGTTNDDIARSVVTHLRAHPEEGRTNAALVILAGLTEAYGCGY